MTRRSAFLTIATVLLAPSIGLSALKAAGLAGLAPQGGNAFVGLVHTLQQNWTWLVGTGLGLVLVLIAGLMVAGSRSAPDWLFRVIGGIMLILVVIPAVLA
jgi:integral membrane sensor domain MASE1